MIARLQRWLGLPETPVDGKKLVVSFELFLDAKCPCGSIHLHRLTLYNTSLCARCGQTIGVLFIEYARTMPSLHPEPHITVGYVQLEKTPRGVH